MSYSFFAFVSRMKYIERWALMRNSRPENLSEHCLDVAMIAHALVTIGNVRYGHSMNADKAAVIGLYHDASEIITGDMPTPVKYYNKDIKTAYKEVERVAEEHIIEMLPEDLKSEYRKVFFSDSTAELTEEERAEELYMRRLVKAADKISALIKCIEEETSGNMEFRTAKISTEKILSDMAQEMPEVKDFMNDFMPSYGKTLDELR